VTDPWALIRDQEAQRLAVAAGDYVVRLTGTDTGGALSIVEFVLAPGAVGAAAHVHHGHEEGFVVLSGRVRFALGGRTGDSTGADVQEVVAGESAVAWVPRGLRHAFANPDDVPARILGLFSPAGYEGYFVQMAEALARGDLLDDAALGQLRANYATTTG